MLPDKEQILDCIYKSLCNCKYDSRVNLARNTIGETTLDSVRIDSLELLQVVFDIESDFDVEIEFSQFPMTGTFGQLAEIILITKK